MKKVTWDRETDELREVDLEEWVSLWGDSIDNRRVAKTEIGDVTVYTSFLGMDHSFGLGGPPLFFETMCKVKGLWAKLQLRYPTAEDARRGHESVCDHVRSGKRPEDFVME